MKRITALAAALLLALSLLTGCAQIDEAEEPLFPPEEDPAPEETAAALPLRLFPSLSGRAATESPDLPGRDAADGSFPAL